MEELIKVEKSPTTGDPIVNARDLYKFLNVKRDFSNWIKDRIVKYGFIKDIDYVCIYFDGNGQKIYLAKNGEANTCGNQSAFRIEYALTLDCAKEFAMVQANEKGKLARQYFIVIEKKWKKSQQVINNSRSIADTAKLFNTNSHQLNILLRKNKYFKPNNHPYQKWVNQGLFLIEQYNPKYYSAKRIKVTENKGLPVIRQLFGQNNLLNPVVVKDIEINNNSQVILIIGERIARLENTMVDFINHLFACGNRKASPIEIEKYRSELRKFKTEIEKENNKIQISLV